jgi:hypothetical protein
MKAKDTASAFVSSFSMVANLALTLCRYGAGNLVAFGHLSMAELVTDGDLARARRDPAFRQRFLADHLDKLLEALNHARRNAGTNPDKALQIREGVDLAVKLAEILNTPNGYHGSQAA